MRAVCGGFKALGADAEVFHLRALLDFGSKPALRATTPSPSITSGWVAIPDRNGVLGLALGLHGNLVGAVAVGLRGRGGKVSHAKMPGSSVGTRTGEAAQSGAI